MSQQIQPISVTIPPGVDTRAAVEAFDRLIEGWYRNDPVRRQMIDAILAEAEGDRQDVTLSPPQADGETQTKAKREEDVFGGTALGDFYRAGAL